VKAVKRTVSLDIVLDYLWGQPAEAALVPGRTRPSGAALRTGESDRYAYARSSRRSQASRVSLAATEIAAAGAMDSKP
jgi:hypothetical protein